MEKFISILKKYDFILYFLCYFLTWFLISVLFGVVLPSLMAKVAALVIMAIFIKKLDVFLEKWLTVFIAYLESKKK